MKKCKMCLIRYKIHRVCMIGWGGVGLYIYINFLHAVESLWTRALLRGEERKMELLSRQIKKANILFILSP